MTNIEQKALELVNEVGDELGLHQHVTELVDCLMTTALCRAIEQHESFRQEVSDAIVFALKVYGGHSGPLDPLRRFIITKPDPLVEVVKEVEMVDGELAVETAEAYRAALAKRGLEIREKGNG